MALKELTFKTSQVKSLYFKIAPANVPDEDRDLCEAVLENEELLQHNFFGKKMFKV